MGTDDAKLSMADMTRKLAEDQDDTPTGSDTIAWKAREGAGSGASQSDDRTGQSLDSQMAQQNHQPAQGMDGDSRAGGDD